MIARDSSLGAIDMGHAGGVSDPGKYPSDDEGSGWLSDHAGLLAAAVVIIIVVFLVDPEF